MSDLPGKLSWDDLRIIKAIGESGGVAAAATMLGVNHTTISRRLSRLEQTLGVAVFDRRRAGYQPTASGAELIALAERVELEIVSVARRVSGPAQGHTGDLLVTTSDALLLDFLTPIVADFKAFNPSIRIEVIAANSALNLARGERILPSERPRQRPRKIFSDGRSPPSHGPPTVADRTLPEACKVLTRSISVNGHPTEADFPA